MWAFEFFNTARISSLAYMNVFGSSSIQEDLSKWITSLDFNRFICLQFVSLLLTEAINVVLTKVLKVQRKFVFAGQQIATTLVQLWPICWTIARFGVSFAYSNNLKINASSNKCVRMYIYPYVQYVCSLAAQSLKCVHN